MTSPTSPNAPLTPKLLKTSDVRKLGSSESFKGIYVVNSVMKRTDKNGKHYWEMTVSDEQGVISAKIWSDAGWWDRSTPELEAKPDMLGETQINELKGAAVGITGKTADFRGQVQYNFNAISKLNPDRYPPSKYMPHSDVPLPVLSARLDALIDACRPEIRDFLRGIFSGPMGRAFMEAPAAVLNHHAYANGLLEHTLAVAESAKNMASIYRDSYPQIDVDIVVAGALLHDLGKTESYSMSPIPEITLPGAVIDHIAIGYAAFVRLAEDARLSPEISLQIGHIMLSHHGQKEFGSPVLPATPEALIVSAADELDFRLFCWKDATRDMAPNQNISAFHFAAQRRFWRVAAPNAREARENS
ncbi:MAG: HD domain-containing protein [Synergistaceae bacterium]|jgi:3'-5' exoribonuclease|nr:HD domain-containing protein [Synergistaceae bacterium]